MLKPARHIPNSTLRAVIRWGAILLVAGLALNMALYAWQVNPDHLQGDQWRWMREVVIPYREGEIGLFEALTFEFAVLSHTHVLTMAEMILNERVFGMNLYVETVIGVLSLFGCLYLFWAYLRNARQMGGSRAAPADISHDIWFYGLLLVSATAIFAIGVTNAFSWTLVTFEHLYLFMALLMIFKFPKLFLERQIGKLIGLMVIIFLLGDAMGSVAILTTLIMAVVLTLADRSYFKPAAIYIGAFVFTLIIAHFKLSGQVSHSQTSTVDALKYMLTHPGKTFEFVFNGLGRGANPSARHFEVLNVKLLTASWGIGLLLSLSIGFLVIKLLWDKRIKENAVALMLIGFALISIFGAMRLRLATTDASYILGERYYRFLVPAFLGALLLAYDLWKRKPAGLATFAFSGLIAGHFLMTGWVSVYTWDKVMPSVQTYFAKWDAAIVDYDPQQEAESASLYGTVNPRCRNNYCDRAILYLRSEELSTFRIADSPGNRD